ncbi:hypothetical protein HETIRDRAFT_412703 [Heterobasidion irregulare TC 32-1]|uniref:Uncharacterized protein n=1 Tax=Heterobasidion irregulare (strain TC 32-1) TaxID=747525 RepID=W4JMH2_HETIT|nr:uncharacterized protein HETIRDRAFT_412703 [Heterobasidion irregulare TC 32-1]ETW74752.1 hypothetical protein HETIRDRAFT_412703 [Heterobasidion irregulare TC 32-1]
MTDSWEFDQVGLRGFLGKLLVSIQHHVVNPAKRLHYASEGVMSWTSLKHSS